MSSLATDSIFIAALNADASLMQKIGGRLYSTAIPLPDEEADNVPVPYIIVTFDGLNNDAQSKDDPYEGDYDSVQVGIEITAENREALAELTQQVRDIVHSYFRSYVGDERDAVEGYQLSAEPVQYDSMKPCFWQTLRYQCDVAVSWRS
jgi:hypothetical protein